jgi:UDPglucose 6-dehydrogenase
MRIAVVGTGYVGLVTGTCFADSGNRVTCLDINADKIAGLNRGEIPIYEPGLEELVVRNAKAGRLRFSTDTAFAIRDAQIVFLAVGTPPAEDGSADLTSLWRVVDAIAADLHPQAVVVTKSTVPVGTCAGIESRLKERTGRDCRVASNPEFLKEGAAIDDFQKPDRVVVGVRSSEVADILRNLYLPFLRTEHPFLVMSPESSEMTKYVSNSLLATKISFINEVANLCERMDADIDDVRRGIGHDSRIGFAFLFPGVGYGGSCFPKDVQALAAMARATGVVPRILSAVHETNLAQKQVLGDKIAAHFGGRLEGRRIAVWGLAFKPRTDDVRDAPAIDLLERLLAGGAQITVYDPEAMENVRAMHGDRLTYADGPMEALDGVECLAIVTEWGDFRRPDFDEMIRRMRSPTVFDGRNLYLPAEMRARGFEYHSIGRTPTA